MRAFSFIVFLLNLSFFLSAKEEGLAFYSEKIHPLLAEHCFKCHGGEEKLKGQFRLTSREGLLRGGEFGPGFDESDPAKSLLLEMISYKDENYQMPPQRKLSSEQIALLKEWILMGAPYDPGKEIKGSVDEAQRGFSVTQEDRQWWAYRPVAKPDAPLSAARNWRRNEIDDFILGRLEKAGLQPNPDAEVGALVRRVYYDLTGLPPSLEEVETFRVAVRDDFEKGWNELIEKLLASSRYGEKWARHWLDLVRYAESNGFERDNSKPEIWKYRDFVINAFNSDLPYDLFVIHQLAGDEIENRSRESLAATGYHRLMQWDDEPADRKQHVYDVLADNVQITSETFLGTTLGCARCHDHKADPISQKDYYSFMSFFHGVTHYETPGTLLHWADETQRREFEKERTEKVSALEKEVTSIEARIREFLEEKQLVVKKGTSPQMVLVKDGRSDKPSVWEYTTEKPSPDWKEVGFSNESWLRGPGGIGTQVPNHAVKTPWNTSEIWIRTSFGLKEIPDALVLDLYHDEDAEVYLNGVEILRTKGYLTNYKLFQLDQKALDALQTGRNTLAIHCTQTSGGQYIDAGLRTPGGDSENLEDIIRNNGGNGLISQIEKHFEAKLYQNFLEKKKEIEQWRNRKAGEPLNVVKENSTQPVALKIHLRGSAHALGEEVKPAFPAVLSESGSDPVLAAVSPSTWEGGASSGRRLALAHWITAPQNPLASRVMVNRIWQHHFGRGIVPSTSDFGKLGENPTHPELLDWMAAHFRDSGWSIKDLHRLILQSRTYRMSSSPNSANAEIDPNNDLFWRNNMRRLTAEEIRDSILSVTGKLVEQVGGNWVYPPLQKEVLNTSSRPGAVWPISKNEADHHRRSLYIHVKRSLRDPMMSDFDQADTDSSCAVRFVTTVPNQALMMLNSQFINDQSKHLAGRLREENGEARIQIAKGIELVTQRSPQQEEVDHCLELYHRLKKEFGLSAEAALERIALLSLNLNEFIYLD